MRIILIILILTYGIAHGQIKINVYSTDKIRWDAAASAAKNAETKAAEAAALANKRSLFIQGPGITFKQVDSNTYIISSEYPPRMTTAKRDSLDVKASRGMFIYNLDKDACEVCNGMRWNQVTTGIIATEPVPIKQKIINPKTVTVNFDNYGSPIILKVDSGSHVGGHNSPALRLQNINPGSSSMLPYLSAYSCYECLDAPADSIKIIYYKSGVIQNSLPGPYTHAIVKPNAFR